MTDRMEAGFRSKKKVRKAEQTLSDEEFPQLGKPTENGSENRERRSYKETMMEDLDMEKEDGCVMFGMESEDRIDTGFQGIEDLQSGIVVDRSNPLCPNFVISEEEHARLDMPFARTLVVKLLGKSTSLAFMKRKLAQIWGRRGWVRVTDVSNEFFMVGFQKEEDFQLAITGGPWIVGDTYLSVMKWNPEFNPKVEKITKAAVWVRLPDMNFKFFDKKMLWNFGNAVGRVLKIDTHTALRARGMYARICVEVDLTKPLLPHYAIDGVVMPIEYESISLLCLKCGRFGHVKERCGSVNEEKEKNGEQENEGKNGNMAEEENGWKVVHRVQRGRKPRELKEWGIGTSRFAVLEQEGEEENTDANVPLKEISNNFEFRAKTKEPIRKIRSETNKGVSRAEVNTKGNKFGSQSGAKKGSSILSQKMQEARRDREGKNVERRGSEIQRTEMQTEIITVSRNPQERRMEITDEKSMMCMKEVDRGPNEEGEEGNEYAEGQRRGESEDENPQECMEA